MYADTKLLKILRSSGGPYSFDETGIIKPIFLVGLLVALVVLLLAFGLMILLSSNQLFLLDLELEPVD